MSEDRLPELFAQAIDLDSVARRELVCAVESEDPELGRELGRLLAAATESSPLDRSPWRDWVDPLVDQTPLERIGPYRVLRELGRGGMGRVYLAEEETPDFRRTLALKVIDSPESDAEATRRFRDEVRILAALEHPGIARFLNGGRATDGTWHLALEYVEGEDVITHAQSRGLSVRERIELFLGVLEAVQYAHERGVIHRDIKPGHLLVGADGRPRLLDFGIAKLLEEGEADNLTLTRTESRALTPAYASPEQFRGERVSAASDVYSLGVVLYELLAGVRPFAAARASRQELERSVLEEDPAPPSGAARRAARTTPDPSPTFRVGVMGAPRTIGRDLDAVCLKALRKQPAERYRSAKELADDLRRYLAGLPVEARRASRRYRLGRYARRHRTEASIGSAVLVTVVAVALVFLTRNQPPTAASSEPPAVVSPPPRAFPFSGAGARGLEELQTRFAVAPGDVEAGAALALALVAADRLPEAELVLARLRQIPGREDDPLADYVAGTIAQRLDEPQRALVFYTQARDNALAGGRGELVAQIRASRGRVLALLGAEAEAVGEMELARADFAQIGDHASLARVTNDLAIEHLQRGEMERGRAMLEEALAAARAIGSNGGNILLNLGIVEAELGRSDLAVAHLREAVAASRERGDPRQLAVALAALAQILADLPSPDASSEAEGLLVESIDLGRRSSEETILAETLFAHAEHALDRGRMAGIDETVGEIERVAASTGRNTGLALAFQLRGRRATLLGDLAAARRYLAEARRLFLDSGEPARATACDLLAAEVEIEAGAHEAAYALLSDGLDRLRGGEGHVVAYRAEALRSRLAAQLGDLAGARDLLAALGEGAESPSLDRRLAYLEARAAVARAGGLFDGARRDLEAALAGATVGSRTVDALRLRLDLAELDVHAGLRTQAEAAARTVAAEAEALDLVSLAARANSVAKQAATLPAEQGTVRRPS